LLASYYYGYIWTQIPGGFLADKFGFKRVFGSTMLLASLVTLLTPAAATYGGFALIVAARAIIGLCHGVAFPAMHASWTLWAPPGVNRTDIQSHYGHFSPNQRNLLVWFLST